MATTNGFKDFVLDQLGELHDLTCRAMFGGYGLYLRGMFFGIIHQGRLYFRTTPATESAYKKHGMRPFRPNAKQTLKCYYEVPVDVIEDAEHLTRWAVQSARR
jgi:DNA transformation protein